MAQTIIFRDAKMETGKLIIDLPPDQRGAVMHWLKTRKDKEYDLTIKEHRERRSLDANAYAWVLMGKIAAVMRLDPVDVYREQIAGVGDNFTPMCVREQDVKRFISSWERNGLGWIVKDLGPSKNYGCRNLAAYHGSSTYDTAQMSRLIDNIVQDCKALGIETLTPDKLSLLKEEWE